MSAQFDHVSVIKNQMFILVVHVLAIQFYLKTVLKKLWGSFYRQSSRLPLKPMCLSVWRLSLVNAVLKLPIMKRLNCSAPVSLFMYQVTAPLKLKLMMCLIMFAT